MVQSKESIKKAHQKWYEKNRESYLLQLKKKRSTPEAKTKQREYYLKNKERYRQNQKEYRLKFPEKRKLMNDIYYNKPEIKEHRKIYGKLRWRMIRETVINHYGGKCLCCGETRLEFLAIDHINGGGSRHRKQLGNGHLYHSLIKRNFPDGFRVLCHNCNYSLGFYGFCPHSNLTQVVISTGIRYKNG